MSTYIYLLPLNLQQVAEVRAALTARRTLLQNANKVFVMEREFHLKKGEDQYARDVEKHMQNHDESIESIDSIIGLINENFE